MKISTISMILFCTLILVLSAIVAIEPVWFNKWNGNLQGVSNVVSYLSMVFSFIALLIATLAYRAAILRPKLRLKIIPCMSEKEEVAILVDRTTKRIPITKPLTSWEIWLVNYGDAAAKYAVVEIKFEGIFFGNETFTGWNKSHHANGMGWYGFQWSSEDKLVVHPNFPVKLPGMNFAGRELLGNKLNIIITIVSDGFKKKTFSMPVKLEHSS